MANHDIRFTYNHTCNLEISGFDTISHQSLMEHTLERISTADVLDTLQALYRGMNEEPNSILQDIEIIKRAD